MRGERKKYKEKREGIHAAPRVVEGNVDDAVADGGRGVVAEEERAQKLREKRHDHLNSR